MKDKILIFIIGLLVGAIIAASGFLIYQNVDKNTNQTTNGEQMQIMQRPDGENPPEMPNGETPPEKPSGAENDTNRPEPPSKNNPSTNNSSN